MRCLRLRSSRLQFSILTVISVLVGFLFGFFFLLYLARGDIFVNTSCFVFSFAFWGKSIIQPCFKLFLAFRIGKGPRAQFTDDAIQVNLVIVGQTFQELFPLCRKRYRKLSHLLFSPILVFEPCKLQTSTCVAYFSNFMLSSRLIANLISLVFQAIHFTISGSMENFCSASEVGASYTQTNRCSGITVHTPTLLIPCFFSNPPSLSGKSKVSLFIFSLFIGQFSGECLDIIKKVAIITLSQEEYRKVTHKSLALAD